MTQNFKLFDILCSNQKWKLSNKQREQLATLCIRIASAFLQVLERRGQRIRVSNDTSEFQGLAAECVADLFKRDNQGTLHYFQNYFESILDFPKDEDEAFFHIRKLTTQKVKQHLSKIYAQRDPEGAKIRRNLRLSARRHENLSIVSEIDADYLSLTEPQLPSSPVFAIKRIYSQELETAFSQEFNPGAGIDILVIDTLRNLNMRYHCCAVEVSLSDFAALIRRFRSLSQNANSLSHNIVETENVFELEEIVNQVLITVKEKVAKYVAKSKLTLDEGLAMTSAIENMAEDALSGMRLQENYVYLSKRLPNMSRNEYFASTRKIFEYLVRLFKEGIRSAVAVSD